MPYRLFDFSSDVGIEGEGESVGEALVELGRAMAHVLTDGSPIAARERRALAVTGARDWPGTAVAWINELVFQFDVDQFLVSEGTVTADRDGAGVLRLRADVRGERFDPGRHQAGRGVKAATFHDAAYAERDGRHRFRLVLDL